MANFSNYAIKWFRFIIFQKHSCLLQACLCRKHGRQVKQIASEHLFYNLIYPAHLIFLFGKFLKILGKVLIFKKLAVSC